MTISILFAVFLGLAFLGVPIAVAVGSSVVSAITFSEIIPMSYFIRGMTNSVDSFTLTAIPFFILGGYIMSEAGISKGLFEVARAFFGRISGGIMMITVVAAMAFGAISGSAYATVAAIGLIALPELYKQGLSKGAAAALIATAGCCGQMIPPSMGLVVYGANNNVSIAGLFAAEILPGILISCCFLAYCYIYGKKHKIYDRSRKYTFAQKLLSLWKAKFSLIMPVIILGGIYSGLFTPTEAAVVAVVYGLIYWIIVSLKNSSFDIKKLMPMFFNTVITTATILFILGVSSGFGKILTIEKIPLKTANLVLNTFTSKAAVLIILNLLVIFLGTFLDGIAINIILSPILLNIAVQYGITPIHFGVMFIFNCTLGILTPPLGANLFVAAQIADTSFEDIVKNIWPWIIAMLIGLVFVIAFPWLSEFIPSLMNT